MAQHIRDEFFQIPIVTRVFTSTCVLTTLAVVSFVYNYEILIENYNQFAATKHSLTIASHFPSTIGIKRRG